jgi:hypothetical protein
MAYKWSPCSIDSIRSRVPCLPWRRGRCESAKEPQDSCVTGIYQQIAEEPLLMDVYIVFGGLLFCAALFHSPDDSPT